MHLLVYRGACPRKGLRSYMRIGWLCSWLWITRSSAHAKVALSDRGDEVWHTPRLGHGIIHSLPASRAIAAKWLLLKSDIFTGHFGLQLCATCDARIYARPLALGGLGPRGELSFEYLWVRIRKWSRIGLRIGLRGYFWVRSAPCFERDPSSAGNRRKTK